MAILVRHSLAVLFIISSLLVRAQYYEMYLTGDSIGISSSPSGGICLMGGATENDEAMKWFLRRADGGDIVVLRASGSDGYNDYFYSELGVELNSVTTLVFSARDASYDPVVIEKISGAEAIWFAGGDQAKYVEFWRDSPVDSTIRAKLNEGLVIGGTSAGMAIMGGYYFSAVNGTIQSEQALANPQDNRITIQSADFLNVPMLSNVITDTHFDERDRSGRLVAFMANILETYNQTPFAIASEEYTAVCIDTSGEAWVFGDFPAEQDFAYFLSVNCLMQHPNPEYFEEGTPLTWNLSGQAIQALKVPGRTSGTFVFNINDWQNSKNGTWEYWWAENGQLNKSTGSPRRCEPLSSSDITETEVLILPNPAEQNTFSIESSSPILSVEAITSEGKKVTLSLEQLSDQKVKATFSEVKNLIILSVETEAGTISKKLINE